MRFVCLAVDYDGTLATDGRVPDPTREALRAARSSGRRLVMVTGRELDDLQRVFDELDLFDRIVAENGALLYDPQSKEETPLADPPPEGFVQALRARKIEPLSTGRVIVATWEPNEQVVLDTIKDHGLELQVIFNKGAVMVLPAGVNKASGLRAALEELQISPHNVVGVGDAENDHAFLALCGCSVAVANALPTVQERADHVTRGARGDGVREVVEGLLEDELAAVTGALERERIVIGRAGDEDVSVDPYAETVMVAGPSGSGKSTLTMASIEALADADYQFCTLDPEGDHGTLDVPVVTLGDHSSTPDVDAVATTLKRPSQNVVVNMLGLPLDDRPALGDAMLSELLDLRARLGHPHWIVIDEAHHMFHRDRHDTAWRAGTTGTLLITVHPDRVAREVLADVTTLVAVGTTPADTIGEFARARQIEPPQVPGPKEGSAVLWRIGSEPVLFQMAEPRSERARHARKYALGELGEDKSFYFRGPEGKLNLRAHNLDMFLRIADGVDDETWTHHLSRGDYSGWVRTMIKDDELADEIAEVESTGDGDGRARIRELIEARYTAPA